MERSWLSRETRARETPRRAALSAVWRDRACRARCMSADLRVGGGGRRRPPALYSAYLSMRLPPQELAASGGATVADGVRGNVADGQRALGDVAHRQRAGRGRARNLSARLLFLGPFTERFVRHSVFEGDPPMHFLASRFLRRALHQRFFRDGAGPARG